MVGTPAFSVVETGDIILAVDGKTVTRFRVSTRMRCNICGDFFRVFLLFLSRRFAAQEETGCKKMTNLKALEVEQNIGATG